MYQGADEQTLIRTGSLSQAAMRQRFRYARGRAFQVEGGIEHPNSGPMIAGTRSSLRREIAAGHWRPLSSGSRQFDSPPIYLSTVSWRVGIASGVACRKALCRPIRVNTPTTKSSICRGSRRPLVTTDIYLFTVMDDYLKILLVKRGADPAPSPARIRQPYSGRCGKER